MLYRFALGTLFVFMLFNGFRFLGASLLWNDEAHTVMQGKLTMKYGYPRVEDERNLVYADNLEADANGEYAYLHPELKATTHSIWLGYYYAALAVAVADGFSDIHTQTFVLRAFFLIMGLWGLYLFWCAFLRLLPDEQDQQFFSIGYWLLMLLSVSLILHLREARYYALLVFELGLLTYAYTIWRLAFPDCHRMAFAGVAGALAMVFYTFYPIFFIAFAALGLIELILLVGSKHGLLHHVKAGLPVLASLVLVVPSWGFFNVFGSSGGELDWTENLALVGQFFLKYEWLLAALVAKGLLVFLLIRSRQMKQPLLRADDPRVVGSLAVFLFFVVYFLVITRIPKPTFVFTRYYIFMIVLLAGSLMMDLTIITSIWRKHKKEMNWLLPAAIGACVLVSFVHIGKKTETWSGRLVELTTPYQGPLDYLVPYLIETYQGNTENIVLATDYEETSFMYYLDCKVTIGFMGNRLEEDLQYRPDVIVDRKYWRHLDQVIQPLVNQGQYQKITFPVQDFPMNNLPQLDGFMIPHQWRTLNTPMDGRMLECFIRTQ
ncbi:MAG: hypothetical protein AAF598_07020 [Bacteroidota bacterium]